MKPIHLAAMVAPSGEVSAACFIRPKPIDLTLETWALVPESVTCAACRETERFAEDFVRAALHRKAQEGK
jgi:hypothetical protein